MNHAEYTAAINALEKALDTQLQVLDGIRVATFRDSHAKRAALVAAYVAWLLDQEADFEARLKALEGKP